MIKWFLFRKVGVYFMNQVIIYYVEFILMNQFDGLGLTKKRKIGSFGGIYLVEIITKNILTIH